MWLEIVCDLLVVVREPLVFGCSKKTNRKSIYSQGLAANLYIATVRGSVLASIAQCRGAA